MSKIGINGFGRIGRLVLRASLERGGQVRREATNREYGILRMISLLILNSPPTGRRDQ